MNFTSVEKKNINKISYNNKNTKDKNNTDKNSINLNRKGKNLYIRKIEPKKFGMKSIIGDIGGVGQVNAPRSNAFSNTISLSSKLSDISEKLEKYENLINKLGMEYQ